MRYASCATSAQMVPGLLVQVCSQPLPLASANPRLCFCNERDHGVALPTCLYTALDWFLARDGFFGAWADGGVSSENTVPKIVPTAGLFALGSR